MIHFTQKKCYQFLFSLTGIKGDRGSRGIRGIKGDEGDMGQNVTGSKGMEG